MPLLAGLGAKQSVGLLTLFAGALGAGSTTHKGGTMRLGTRRTILETVDCIAAKLYQSEQYIDERHRHRYEVNPELVPQLEEAGLRFVGKDETGTRMEIVELAGHKFYVSAQFHPEFKSRPFTPSPLFLGLILAASGRLDNFLSGRATPICSPVKPSPKLMDHGMIAALTAAKLQL